jgi:hypothetical protein
MVIVMNNQSNQDRTYIYERVDDQIYAREFGSTHRQLVGCYDSQQKEVAERRYYMNHINTVLIMCEKYPDMRELLDRLFVLYNLRKVYD